MLPHSALLAIRSSDLPAEGFGKCHGIGMNRKLDPDNDGLSVKLTAKRRRLNPLVIEPLPHRFHAIRKGYFLGDAYLDRKSSIIIIN